jgi:hypothetical protein
VQLVGREAARTDRAHRGDLPTGRPGGQRRRRGRDAAGADARAVLRGARRGRALVRRRAASVQGREAASRAPQARATRDVSRRNFGQDTKRSAAAHALLEEHGWIRNAEPDRHDSTRWETHPQIRLASVLSAVSGDTEISVFEPPPSSIRTVEPNHRNGGTLTETTTVEQDQTDPTLQISRKGLTVLTLGDEKEPRFESMPDAELDRFDPVSPGEAQHFELTPSGAPASLEAVNRHDALIPDEADHHLAETVDWEAP